MPTAVPTLPETQALALASAYSQAVAAKRLQAWIGAAILAVCIAISWWIAEIDLVKFWQNIGNFPSYIGRLFFLETGQPVWTDFTEWFWGLRKWSGKLLETLVIAYVGTILGLIGALALCFLAAQNVTTDGATLFFARRFLEFCRTVPELVFALLFVAAFGLGPLPGVLAIAIHTMGALGKLYYEVVENADMKPFEGVVATGGRWTDAIRYAIVPQIISNFASYGLLRFEINVRGAAIMGFVGAGGIGQDLLEAVQKFYYSDVSALLVIIIATVMVIDLFTERLRHHMIDMEQSR
jgi:phosphonate transport system permease protein